MNNIKELLKQHTQLAETLAGKANEMVNKLPNGLHKTLFKSAMVDAKSGNIDMSNVSTFVNNLKDKVYASSDNNSK